MNSITITGNITRDVELKFLTNGKAVGKFTVAVKSPRSKDKTIFLDVTVWEKQAEACAQYLSKGSKVLVKGELEIQEWDDKKTGEKKSKPVITADGFGGVEFLSTKKDGGERETKKAFEDNQDIPF